MAKSAEDWRPDVEQALGDAFGECVSPPVPFEGACSHECCEVVWSVAGRDVTPTRLARLGETEIAALAARFGEYFESAAPTVEQIKDAVPRTSTRWPGGSREESAWQTSGLFDTAVAPENAV